MNTNRIKELEINIFQARDDYYNGQSKVSDKVYDAWIDELRLLDPTNKAVIAIGALSLPSEWKKAKHQIPMGSLDKVNTPTELDKWVDDTLEVVDPDGKLCITEKLDGISIEVIYDNGVLTQAISRGDGEIGENITVNVIKMNGVKPQLKDNFTGSLRGEIIMRKSIHQQFFTDKANPRNAASGVSKRLDGVGVDKLDILFYQALGDIDMQSETLQFLWLREQGLNTPHWWIVESSQQVNDFWRNYQDTKREALDYDIDGLVIRLDNIEKQELLGKKNLRPVGAVAFKFDNISREAYVSGIEIQVGNSGRITPIAVFNPKVHLMGADVEKASLHNFSNIASLELDVGATVLVCRANDVIPFVEEVVKKTGTIFQSPTHCPACNTALIEVGEYVQCPNTTGCRSQIIGRVKNWVKELNLLEWGDTLIEKLVDAKLVVTVADLYILKVNDIANLDRMGEKSAQKCYDILHANKRLSLEVFLGGLSIPMIGQSTIKAIISTGCDTLEKFGQLGANEFEMVPGVGPTKAKFLADGLTHNKQIINELMTNGIKIKEITIGKLTGMSFCITGSTNLKRAVLEQMISDNGGINKSTVSKGITYLMIADVNSQSSKAAKARSLGTKLISEDEFLDMLK